MAVEPGRWRCTATRPAARGAGRRARPGLDGWRWRSPVTRRRSRSASCCSAWSRVEPAPSDGVFAIVIAVALVTGRFDIARVPLAVFALLGAAVLPQPPVRGGGARPGGGSALSRRSRSTWRSSRSGSPATCNSERRARLVSVSYLIGRRRRSRLGIARPVRTDPRRRAVALARRPARPGLFEDPNVYGPFLDPAGTDPAGGAAPPAAAALSHHHQGRHVHGVAGWRAVLLLACRLGNYGRRGRRDARGDGAETRRRPTGRHDLGRAGAGGRLLRDDARADQLGRIPRGARIVSRATTSSVSARSAPGSRSPSATRSASARVSSSWSSRVSTHSTYVRALAEQGVLGLVVVRRCSSDTLVLASRNAVLGRSTYGIGSAALLAAWVGLARQLVRGRHAALAAPLGHRGHDLGRRDDASGGKELRAPE